jgi:phospholipid/cholesterol/gamma-HCH transport system permease protein
VNDPNADLCKIKCTGTDNNTVVISLSGRCKIESTFPDINKIFKHPDFNHNIRNIIFESSGLVSWDSGLLTFLEKILKKSSTEKIDVTMTGLPEGVQRLIKLANAVPPKKDTGRGKKHASIITRAGESAISLVHSTKTVLNFTGETCMAASLFFTGKAHFQRSDLMYYIQECGPTALPIVTLISLLIGLILAFVGAVQLKMFGAQIYIANLVGLGMAREMGAMMSAIIMAGRTGAAFAAQLGTMQVNEEIDALKTMGIPPVEFLVLPRIIALVLMMPLLTIYAIFMGILGGAIVGVGMMDLSVMQYYHQTVTAITLTDFSLGFIKSIVFGVIIALSGCLRGMQCSRSSSAVGDAATSAVVTGIVWIIISDSVLTIIYSILGI